MSNYSRNASFSRTGSSVLHKNFNLNGSVSRSQTAQDENSNLFHLLPKTTGDYLNTLNDIKNNTDSRQISIVRKTLEEIKIQVSNNKIKIDSNFTAGLISVINSLKLDKEKPAFINKIIDIIKINNDNKQKELYPELKYLLASTLTNFGIGDLHYYKLNFDREKLKDQNLKNAILKWAYLPRLQLSKLNISHGRLDFSFISGSDFSNAKCIRTGFIEATAVATIFIHADLTDADWTRGNISGSDFSNAKCIRTIFIEATAAATIFIHADLTGADWTRGDISGSDFSHGKCIKTLFIEVTALAAIFIQADLTDADWTRGDISGSNFSHGICIRTRFIESTARDTIFSNADLTDADLTDADWTRGNISGSNFSHGICIRTRFIESTATNAIFSNVDLTDADWTRGDFTNVNVTGATLTRITLTGTILTGIRGDYENLIHCFTENNTLGDNKYDILLEIIRLIEGNQLYNVNDLDKQNVLFGPLYRNIQNNNTSPNVLNKIITIENLVLRERCLNLFFDSLLRKGLNVSLKEIFSQPNQDFTIFSKHYIEYLINHRFNFTAGQAREHLNDLNELNLIRPYLRKFIDARIAFENSNNNVPSQTTTMALGWANTLDGIVPNRIHILASCLAPLISGASDLFVEEAAPYLDQEEGKERKIFISNDENHLFYLSHDYFQALITGQEPPLWGNGPDRIYFVFDDSNAGFEYRAAKNSEKKSDTKVFSRVPFLHERYSARRIFRGLSGLLGAMNLGDYSAHFLDAVNDSGNDNQVSLTSPIHQNGLSRIFNAYIDNERVHQIFITILGESLLYDQMNNEQKSQLLSVLSFIFTRLSSDVFFGGRYDSPVILRLFAIALLNTASELNPNLQITHGGVEWKSELISENCSEQISRLHMFPVVRNYNIYRQLSPWQL